MLFTLGLPSKTSSHLCPFISILQMKVSSLDDFQSRTKWGIGRAPFVHMAPQTSLKTQRHLTKAEENRGFSLGIDHLITFLYWVQLRNIQLLALKLVNEFDSIENKKRAAFLFHPLEKKFFFKVHGLHIRADFWTCMVHYFILELKCHWYYRNYMKITHLSKVRKVLLHLPFHWIFIISLLDESGDIILTWQKGKLKCRHLKGLQQSHKDLDLWL